MPPPPQVCPVGQSSPHVARWPQPSGKVSQYVPPACWHWMGWHGGSPEASALPSLCEPCPPSLGTRTVPAVAPEPKAAAAPLAAWPPAASLAAWLPADPTVPAAPLPA